MTALALWFEQLARNVGIVAAFIVAVGVIAAKTPLSKVLGWIWGRLVGQPVTDWFEVVIGRVVHRVVDPLLKEFSDRNDAQHADNVMAIHAVEARVAGVEANTKAMDGRLVHIEDHITKDNPMVPHIVTTVTTVDAPGEAPK